MKIVNFILKTAVAIIYIQTLYFKFSAHPDSVYIFSQLGLEPYGRLSLGVIELITAILILNPRTTIYGMLLSTGVISGAVASHLGPLGIEVQGDGGSLFLLAVAVQIMSVGYLLINFSEIKIISKKLIKLQV